MDHNKRIKKLNEVVEMLNELEDSKIQFDATMVLEELVDKYEEMLQNETSVQNHPDNNWEEECEAIGELLKLISCLQVSDSRKISFFSGNTIRDPKKRIDTINLIGGLFKNIREKVLEIEDMKEMLEQDFERVINNTEDTDMLFDVHENAKKDEEELENMSRDILDKYKQIVDALDRVVEGAC